MFQRSLTSLSPSHGMTLHAWVAWRLTCFAVLLMIPIGAHAEADFLAPFRAYPTGATPGIALVADFDGDHYRDLAVTVDGSKVLIFRGTGGGNFEDPTESPMGPYTGAIAVADLNGDGSPDLALARGDSNNSITTFSILIANGDGTFADQADIGWQYGRVGSVALADVSGDGHADFLATTDSPNSFSYVVRLLGNGDGTFGPVTFLPNGPYGTRLRVSDLNSDGAPDLVLARSGSGTVVATQLGNGDGTFRAPVGLSTSTATPVSMAIADFNRDGHPDLALGSAPTGVAIHLGNGDGTFAPRQSYSNFGIPTSIVAGDVNGDGFVDLAAANGNSTSLGTGTISVFLGVGDGTLANRTEFVTGGTPFLNMSYDPGSIACSDLNHDGKMDLATVNPSSETISVHLGNGDATFGHSAAVASGPYPTAIVAGDFDADGVEDLVVSHPDSTLSIHLANRNGTVASRIVVAGQHVPVDLGVADLDRDGHADLVTLNSDSTVSVRLGSGSGSLGSPTDYLVRPVPRHLTLADLNGDGIPDLVVNCGHLLSSTASTPYISVFLGLGDGRVGPRMDTTMPSHVAWTGVADMNGDLVPDLVVVRDYSSLSILPGNGDGTFGAGTDFPGLEFHGRGSLADVDGDGRTDVVFVGSHSSPHYFDLVCVYRGMGDGTLGSLTEYGGPANGAQTAVADVDQDGHADIAVAGGRTNTVSILYGRADGAFDRGHAHGSSGGPFSFVLGDWNGDGRPDVATADYFSSNVSILQNATGVLAADPFASLGSVRLGAAYPNPARVSLAIPFETVTAGNAAIRVYDLAGRIVKVVMQDRLPAGRHVVAWDVRTAEGRLAPPGVYFYELTLGRERRAKQLAIIR